MKKKGFFDYLKQQAGEGIHFIYCAHCKVDADYIGDRLERHLPSCEYRITKQKPVSYTHLTLPTILRV